MLTMDKIAEGIGKAISDNTALDRFIKKNESAALASLETKKSHTLVVPLETLGDLPKEIPLCRLYFLRANTKAPKERHKNSKQRLVSLRGSGSIWVEREGEWRKCAVDARRGWHVVEENTWHFPESDDKVWVTLAFHTASNESIVDEVVR